MADLDTVGILDVGGDGPITAAGRAQVTHFGKCSLFSLVLDQRTLLADPPAERPIAAEILPGAPLMALGVADPLSRSAFLGASAFGSYSLGKHRSVPVAFNQPSAPDEGPPCRSAIISMTSCMRRSSSVV